MTMWTRKDRSAPQLISVEYYPHNDTLHIAYECNGNNSHNGNNRSDRIKSGNVVDFVNVRRKICTFHDNNNNVGNIRLLEKIDIFCLKPSLRKKWSNLYLSIQVGFQIFRYLSINRNTKNNTHKQREKERERDTHTQTNKPKHIPAHTERERESTWQFKDRERDGWWYRAVVLNVGSINTKILATHLTHLELFCSLLDL